MKIMRKLMFCLNYYINCMLCVSINIYTPPQLKFRNV